MSKVVRLIRNPEYAHFKCVIFDTAPTGHTLRLLTLPDFLEQSVGKIVRLRYTISRAVGGITNFFKGKSGESVDVAMEKLTELQVCSELHCDTPARGTCTRLCRLSQRVHVDSLGLA